MSHYYHSRLLRLHSRDLPGSSKYSAVFHVNERELQAIRSVVLKSVMLPNTQFNVNRHTNTWRFPNSKHGTDVFVLPVGQYTLSELIPALEALVPGLTITVEFAGFLTFGMDVGTFDIIADPVSNPLGYYLLGERVQLLGYPFPITMTTLPDLSGLRTVYIVSNTLSPFGCMCSSQRIMRNTFCSVPITVPYGEFISHEEHSSLSLDFSKFAQRNISTIDITILDAATMKPVELNGLDYELVFRVYT